jgi:hypothetical protein
MYSYWKIKPSQEAVTGSVIFVRMEKGVKPNTKPSQKAVRVPSSAYSRYVNQELKYAHDYSQEFTGMSGYEYVDAAGAVGFSDANPF